MSVVAAIMLTDTSASGRRCYKPSQAVQIPVPPLTLSHS